MLRIGFDSSPLLPGHPPGVQRVVERSLEALEQRGRIEVVRLTPDSPDELRSWRQRELPRTVRERGLVGIHSFVSAFAWRGPGHRVQTLHEAPWRHGVQENADLRHRFWAWAGARRASAVITPTAATARDLGLTSGRLAGRTHVIPWGVGLPFEGEAPPNSMDEILLGKYHLPDRPLLLCPGGVRAKKNLRATLEGLAHLKQSGSLPVQLVVTGPDTPDLRASLGLVQRLGLTRHVSTPGEISDADLAGLMRLSCAVSVLSTSEGFGLPVLEAMACGTPAIVPAGGALEEVAGAHAIVVDPTEASSVGQGIVQALDTREELRTTLTERASRFTWGNTALSIEQVWEGLA
ncbi:MAG: glycosyltransferase family 1 protein [Planctomycetota bacterium]|nr:glycosyltransferase family 1 protein [Planctomycetota bacterium]